MLEYQKNIEEMLHYEGLLYISKIIYFELISKYHNNLLVDYFRIKKTQELIAHKYYYPMLLQDIKAYIKSSDIYMTSKAIRYKPYSDI